jgi:HAD superfamily hydrolase (TIGR01458 family)
MINLRPHIKGFLIDLDGVLYVGNELIPGAAESIRHIKSVGLPCRFATNTTTKSLATLYNKLQALNLPIEKEEIISAPHAAVLHLRKLDHPVCHLCMNDDVKTDFAEFEISDHDPDIVVVGDIDDGWTYDIMNRLFQMIVGKAEIVALHKGRYWHEPDGLRLDIGAFVSGLEYATGKTATVIGKPNEAFFKMAVEDMDLVPEDVAMIGDDIESDIGGSQAAGMKGILVKTGKYREELVDRSHIIPYAVMDSIAELKNLI